MLIMMNKAVQLLKQIIHVMKSPFHSIDSVSEESDHTFMPMSNALSKTERFLKVGPYVLWFGMHFVISLIIIYQRNLGGTVYYLITYVFFSSLIIWLFGYKTFPEYLAREGKLNLRLGVLIGLNILLFILGISSLILLNQTLQAIPDQTQYAPSSVRVAIWVLMVSLGIIFMASTRVAQVYYHNAVQKIEHKAQKVEAELQLLKTQISPHFLFNTLNNIYGLAYLGDERAAEMISKLSKIMRYLLYDCEQQKVLLSKEKDMIEHYLSIQLLKHEDPRNVDFYHAGITFNNMITPMVLINFVENCFKHSDLESNPEAWIKISLEIEKNELYFRTENTIREDVEETQTDRKGIGLTNSLKLLDANYPGKHEVEITRENHVYQLDLKITL